MIELVKNIKFMRAWKFENDFEYETLGYTKIRWFDKTEVKVLDGNDTEGMSKTTVKVREIDNTKGMSEPTVKVREVDNTEGMVLA